MKWSGAGDNYEISGRYQGVYLTSQAMLLTTPIFQKGPSRLQDPQNRAKPSIFTRDLLVYARLWGTVLLYVL